MRILISLALIFTFNIYSQNSWQHLSGPPGGLAAQFLKSPVNNNLFVSTFGLGILRSTDNGNSWNQVNNGFPRPIFDNGGVYFAFRSNGYIYASSFTKGLWRSTNNGDSWTQTGLVNAIVSSVIILQNGSILICSEGSHSIMQSTDDGNTWTTVTSGLPSQVTIFSFIEHNGAVYAAGTGIGGSFFKSTDNGNSWVILNAPNVSVQSLAVTPSGNIFAASLQGMYRSTNNGVNWSLVNSGLSVTRFNFVYCNPQGVVFAAADSSLWRTSNNGNNWSLAGFANRDVGGFIQLPDGSYIASVREEGIFKSTNQGSSWQTSNNGFGGLFVNSLDINQNSIIAATSGGLWRSTDSGTNWQIITTGLNGSIFNSVKYLSASTILCGGDSGIFRSTNSGNTWQKVLGLQFYDFVTAPNGYIFSSGLYPFYGIWQSTNMGSNWSLNNFNFSPLCLTVSPSGHLFAGTSGGGVYRSTNNGVNWIQHGPAGVVRSITAAPNGYIFASYQSGFPDPSGIYRSTNSGTGWEYTGFNIQCNTMTVNSAGYLFAGTFGGGVYRSTNNGLSFDTIQTGLYNQLLGCLKLNSGGFLYTGTYYGGIYKSSGTTIGVTLISNEVPEKYALEQNYPNPFNPGTKINFSVPKSGLVTLKIYDALGREILLLVDGEYSTGSYSVDFDGSSLPSGVYFYKITSGNFTDIKKMVLVK